MILNFLRLLSDTANSQPKLMVLAVSLICVPTSFVFITQQICGQQRINIEYLSHAESAVNSNMWTSDSPMVAYLLLPPVYRT